MDPELLAFIKDQVQAAEQRAHSNYQQREAQLQLAWEQREAQATEGWLAQKVHLERQNALLETKIGMLEEQLGGTHIQPNTRQEIHVSANDPIILHEPEQEEPVHKPLPATPKRKVRVKASLTPSTPPAAQSTRKRASNTTASPTPVRMTRSASKGTTGTPPVTVAPHPAVRGTPRSQQSGNSVLGPSATATPPSTPVRKPKPKQLLKKDIPTDALLLKEYMFTHARLISNAADAGDVLGDPDPADKAAFNTRFSNEAQVFEARTGPSLIPKSAVKVRPYHPQQTTQSRTLTRLANIEATIVEYTAAQMSRVGVTRWAPDYTETPGSLWNTAMSFLLIDTFRQAIVAGAYDFNSNHVWKKFITDMDLMVVIYDHVVWYHFYDKWREEKRAPGAAQAEKERQAMYAVKRKKAKARKLYCKKNKFHRLAHYLFDIKATSEDERDPAQSFIGKRPVYYPRRRPERAPEADLVIRLVDKAIDITKELTRNSKRPREDPVLVTPPIHERSITLFPAFPPNMPIDYYDPDFFNALPLEIRKKVNINALVLPSDASKALNRRDADGKLTGTQLMKKYRDTVLSRYDLDGFSDDDEGGSGEDTEGNDYSCSEEEGEEESNEDEGNITDLIDDDDATMSFLDEEELREHTLFSRRSGLAAHLSIGNVMDIS